MNFKQLTFLALFVSFIRADGIMLPASLQTHFTQEIINPKNKKIIYQGTMLFSDDKYIKWSYTSPTKKEVCTDGKELAIVDHDLEQITLYSINKGFNLPAVLKTAKKQRDGSYEAQYQNKKYTIILKNGTLQKVGYVDDLDNKVVIVFDNINYSNSSISHSKLVCPAPKDYDIYRG